MKEFVKNLFSLEEERVSILILVFCGVICMGLWKTFRYGDFPPTLFNLATFLGGYVCVSNVSKQLTNKEGSEQVANKKSEL